MSEHMAVNADEHASLLVLVRALETFVAITREYPMSGKQYKALRMVEAARCGRTIVED